MTDLVTFLWGDNDDEVPPIDSMKKGLGEAKVARIRAAQNCTGKRQPCSTNIDNPLIDIDLNGDIIYGAANSEGVSPALLTVILESLPVINWREVQIALNCSQRTAQRYVQVARCAILHMKRHMEKENGS